MKSGVSCSGLVGIVEVEAVAVSEDIVEGDTWKGLLEGRTGRERKKIDTAQKPRGEREFGWSLQGMKSNFRDSVSLKNLQSNILKPSGSVGSGENQSWTQRSHAFFSFQYQSFLIRLRLPNLTIASRV